MSTPTFLQEPLFPPMVVSASDKYIPTIRTSLTDMGLCTTINSNTIKETFNISNYEEIQPFAEILDLSTTQTSPLQVKGSGFIHRTIFWLNVRNPNPLAAGTEYGKTTVRGGISAAINNWNEQFSVRSIQLIFLSAAKPTGLVEANSSSFLLCFPEILNLFLTTNDCRKFIIFFKQ